MPTLSDVNRRRKELATQLGKRRHSTGSESHKGAFHHAPASELLPAGVKRKRQEVMRFQFPANAIRPPQLRRSVANETDVVTERINVGERERKKWFSYIRFLKLQFTVGRRIALDTVCEEEGISLSTLLRLIRKIDSGKPPVRKEGSGLHCDYDNENDINEYMMVKARGCKYIFSIREMSEWVKERFGRGTVYIVRKIMKKYNWRRSQQIIKPILSSSHRSDRLTWSLRHLYRGEGLQSVFGDNDTCYIHVDEKWFYLFRLHQNLWLPRGVTRYDEDAVCRASSKTNVPKVMFIAALGCPRKDRMFNGDIGIWPITYTRTAKTNSSYHKKGDKYEDFATINGKKFVEIMKEKVIPAAVSKVGHWAKNIIIQIDSAGGHKVKTSTKELTFLHESGVQVQCITQPTRSPDLNVLDLGAWHSIQVAFDKFKRDSRHHLGLHIPQKKIHEIIDLVQGTWAEWAANEERTAKLFGDVIGVMKEIIRLRGDNNFEVRHRGRLNHVMMR